MNGYGLDVNARCARTNKKMASVRGNHFIEVCLMDEYLDDPDEFGYRKPNVSYADVEGSEYLQIVRVDKDGNVLSRVSSYLSENEVEAFLIGYDVAVEAFYYSN